MADQKELEFAIEEPIFDQFRADLNQMLRKTIRLMTSKSTNDAVITIKLPVHVELQNIPDGGLSREAPVPRVKHEISCVMQFKDKMSGQPKGEFELVFDEDGNPYYRPINNGQTSIWDDDGNIDIGEDSYAEADAKSLAAPPMRGLPETATAEDAEFEQAEEVEEVDLSKPFKDDGKVSPYEWLAQFLNQDMTIVAGSKGFSVRSADDRIVLSTLADEGHPFYVPAKKVEKHVGHKIVCVPNPETAEGDDIKAIEIWCDDCGEYIFGIENPNFADDYEYDEPEV